MPSSKPTNPRAKVHSPILAPAARNKNRAKKPKIKITNNRSTPATPVASAAEASNLKPQTTKAGRATKPSAKILESQQIDTEGSEDEIEVGDESTINVQAPPKKIKLNIGPAANKTPTTPVVLKAKVKGKPPKRPLGDGYDSEASDREIDPAIEEQFILRMLPGDDCDYLQKAISEKRFGIPKQAGGADIHMKFFQGDGRRAAVTIRGNAYAATLVDLPTVIESMKSWDKRGFYKSADVCQMLLVFAPIKKEEDAKTIEIPKIVDPDTFQYPHGLTAPMHDARKKRFRKRISRTAIEAVEDAVEALLQADAQALSTRYEMIDLDTKESGPYSESDGGYEDEYEDEDAEGELDDTNYFTSNHHAKPDTASHMGSFTGANVGHVGSADTDMMGDDFSGDLEADLERAFDEVSFSGTPQSAAATPMQVDTPAAVEGVSEEDSGDESLEGDEGEDDEGAVEMDENERARLAQLQGTKEDIADLEKQILNVQSQHSKQVNPILKKRLEENIRKLRAELELKKSSLGEDE
jgi:transcription initiation factor TFIID subunit 7